MPTFAESGSMSTGPVDDTPVPDRVAEFQQRARAWGEVVRRSLKSCDSNDEMELELNRRRNEPGQ